MNNNDNHAVQTQYFLKQRSMAGYAALGFMFAAIICMLLVIVITDIEPHSKKDQRLQEIQTLIEANAELRLKLKQTEKQLEQALISINELSSTLEYLINSDAIAADKKDELTTTNKTNELKQLAAEQSTQELNDE